MKLTKPIRDYIVVNPYIEEEDKELLAILHEDGYKWYTKESLIDFSYWETNKSATCYVIDSGGHLVYPISIDEYKNKDDIMSFLYLREEYCNKNNVKIKNLNLCELLKGCEGLKIYNSDVDYDDTIQIVTENKIITEYNVYESNGGLFKWKKCVLYPSIKLYHKYFDPYDAWMAWKEQKETIEKYSK